MTTPLAILTMFFGAAANPYLALVDAKIYVSPTEEPIPHGVVLIQGGKIAAVGRRQQVQIPKGAQIVDCSGRSITAGFWNSHVHFLERKFLARAIIKFGGAGRFVVRDGLGVLQGASVL